MSKRKRKVLSVEDMIKLKTMSSFSLFTRKLKDWDGLFYFTLFVNESDTRSNVHYLSSSENKAWKKFGAPVSQRSWVQIPYRPEFFSGLIFTTAQVVYITASITFIHVFICSSNIWLSYILSRIFTLFDRICRNFFLSSFSSFRFWQLRDEKNKERERTTTKLEMNKDNVRYEYI